MEKYDIVNGLAWEFGFRRYLEICSPSTGGKFRFVDASLFDARDRLMYRCPDDFADGLDINFRTAADNSHEMIRQLDATLSMDARYDIILVDPYHTYRESLLDLRGAMCLLRPGGILVVHDCNPTDPKIASPNFVPGDWCGVTYQAFVDFVLGVRCAAYCTVDDDYGCGVVFGAGARVPEAWRGARPAEALALDWTACRDDDDRRFAFFQRHRSALLNLVSVGRFQAVHPFTRFAHPASEVADNGRQGDPHLVANGQRIDAVQVGERGWEFLIPVGTRSLHLRSGRAQPGVAGAPHDRRQAGLCLTSLMAQVGDVMTTLPLDHPRLGQGLYEPERAGASMWRWTRGDTPLPMSLLGGGRMPVILFVQANNA